MDTFENQSQREEDVLSGGEPSRFKQRLGDFGRRMKRIDLRSTIIEHPFAAVGIAAGAGAIVGLIRPMPKRGRISGALVAALSTIGFRLVREAAMQQLGQYAKQALARYGQQGRESVDVQSGYSAQAPQAGTTRY